jgi:toxin ParE1/3/4
MQLRWTAEAANDLERIADYLFEHAPDRAAELVLSVYDAPAALLTFPNRGRLGKKEGTREFVLSPLPYLIVYGASSKAFHSYQNMDRRKAGP